MLDTGDGLGLRAEAGAFLPIGVIAAEDHLEGDDAVEAGLAGLVHDAHSAAAEDAEDLVAGDGVRDAVADQLARLRGDGGLGVGGVRRTGQFGGDVGGVGPRRVPIGAGRLRRRRRGREG